MRSLWVKFIRQKNSYICYSGANGIGIDVFNQKKNNSECRNFIGLTQFPKIISTIGQFLLFYCGVISKIGLD